MSNEELQLIKKYLKKYLTKDFIKLNFAFYSSFILFVRKLSDELRFCVNYKKLNTIIKKNRYSLFLISEIIARLTRVKRITKIDIRHIFNKIKMKFNKNEELIIFTTKYENY